MAAWPVKYGDQGYAASAAPQTWKNSLNAVFFPAGRRRDIDGLRGLAVLLVMFFHAGWISGGFIGVDIFIVISGYFMGRSAFMQHPFRPERFVLRRLYRLVPALLVMVSAVSAGMLWWVLQSDRSDIALNGAYALVYLSNIWASHHVGYFEGQSIAYPFLHTWSLSLEMQFYCVIFLIALLLPRLRAPAFSALYHACGFFRVQCLCFPYWQSGCVLQHSRATMGVLARHGYLGAAGVAAVASVLDPDLRCFHSGFAALRRFL